MLERFDVKKTINPAQLQDAEDQKILLTLLAYGEQQLALEKNMNRIEELRLSSGRAIVRNTTLTDPVIKRKFSKAIREIGEALSDLPKMLTERMILLEEGAHTTSLLVRSINLLDQVNEGKRVENGEILDDLIKLKDEIDNYKDRLKPIETLTENMDYTNLKPNENYSVCHRNSDKSVIYQINVSQEFLLRERGSGKRGVVYEVFQLSEQPGEQKGIGAGAFGIVEKLQGKIKRSGQVITYMEYGKDTADKYIVKSSQEQAAVSAIIKESAMMTHLPHAHAKPARISEQSGRIVMRYFPDVDLEQVMQRPQEIISGNYSPGDFITELILKLARAYEDQMYKQRIIHGDIKPNNVRIQIIKSPEARNRIREINLIDFNLSQISNPESRLGGTTAPPQYRSPEIFSNQGVSIASDIYALGLVMIEASITIGMDPKLKEEYESCFKQLTIAAVKADEATPGTSKLNKSLEEVEFYIGKLIKISEDAIAKTTIPLNMQAQIIEMFKKMLSPDPKARPALNEIVPIFENIKFQSHPDHRDPSMISAHNAAITIRENLQKIEKASSERYSQIPAISSENNNVISQDILAKLVELNSNDMEDLKAIKENIINGISELNGNALSEFIDTLGIDELQDLKSTIEIESRIERVMSTFENYNNTIIRLYATLAIYLKNPDLPNAQKIELDVLRQELEDINAKRQKYSLTLDDVAALNIRFEKRLDLFTDKVKKLGSEIERPAKELHDANNAKSELQDLNNAKSQISEILKRHEKNSKSSSLQLWKISNPKQNELSQLSYALKTAKSKQELVSSLEKITNKPNSSLTPFYRSKLREDIVTAITQLKEPHEQVARPKKKS